MSAFKKFQGKLESQGMPAYEAGAVAAKVGDEKYGKNVMHKAAASGVSAAAMKRRLAKG